MREGALDWKREVRQALASGRHAVDESVVEELAQHAAAEFARARADGMDDGAARARVARLLNNWRADRSALRHRSRESAALEAPPIQESSSLAGIGHEVRYALRLLARQPRFALIAILTLALGIGTTTLLFTVTYGVLVQPLPWPNADRVVVLKETRGATAPRFGSMTNVVYESWRSEATTVDGLAAWSQRTVTLTGAGDPERIRIVTATASLFEVLGVQPLIGGFYGRALETTPVVVLSEALWRQRFGGDPSIVGRLVQFDGAAHTVVGVLAD